MRVLHQFVRLLKRGGIYVSVLGLVLANFASVNEQFHQIIHGSCKGHHHVHICQSDQSSDKCNHGEDEDNHGEDDKNEAHSCLVSFILSGGVDSSHLEFAEPIAPNLGHRQTEALGKTLYHSHAWSPSLGRAPPVSS